MKTKFLSLIITCLLTVSAMAQANLNAYKYVIVPNKYDFLREKDQYQANSLTKFLFEKYGFKAVMEGESYPEDLKMNRCLALKSDAIKDSGLFKTKVSIELKDCNDVVLLTTEFGESREKEYKKAYNEAIRDAFKDIEALNYTYEPVAQTVAETTNQTTNTEQEIQQLKEELEALKAKESVASTAVVPVVSTSEKQPEKEEVSVEDKVTTNVLYAQEIENGYQLVDATPKVVYKLTKTAQPNLFLVNGENAIIYKKGEAWIIEFNTSEGAKQKELNIKF
ncbi:hypothetical protein [Aestuariibaculum sediminum]|uniref:Uncharacterized protein n=1 Tax=Aestuariibaculum sediminum TaxID=2770637 RepID=A0A8J6PXJ4_9FLAO|nr:hypothetical protein [Aestuariibaculum sediminum]MBD0830707.1 hypothetical protein [Aestuariibaculum sediminum]